MRCRAIIASALAIIAPEACATNSGQTSTTTITHSVTTATVHVTLTVTPRVPPRVPSTALIMKTITATSPPHAGQGSTVITKTITATSPPHAGQRPTAWFGDPDFDLRLPFVNPTYNPLLPASLPTPTATTSRNPAAIFPVIAPPPGGWHGRYMTDEYGNKIDLQACHSMDMCFEEVRGGLIPDHGWHCHHGDHCRYFCDRNLTYACAEINYNNAGDKLPARPGPEHGVIGFGGW